MPAWPRIPAAGTWAPFTATGPALRSNLGVDPSTGAVAGVPTPNPDVPENDWSLGAVVGTTIRVDWIAPGANGVLVEVAEWGLNSPVTTPTNAVIDTAGITLNFGSTPNPGDTIIYSGAALQSATPYSRPKTQSKTV